VIKSNSTLRNLIVGLHARLPLINGQYVTSINLDNAATTPPFHAVLRDIEEFSLWYASIHRGAGYKSILSSNIYEDSRDVVKQFVNADVVRDVVIYTKNTTEAINLLSHVLAQDDNDGVIISTEMEHLANDLPWRDKFKVEYVRVDQCGKLDVEDLEIKLRKHCGNVKLVTVTGASNVTGYKNPIDHIATLTHKCGAKILVDGAQLVPHCPVDMKDHDSPEHIDYLVFSAHKMYAPFGIGVLIGPKETFEERTPMCKGGGAVKLVSRQFVEWESPPYKDEAGTPNAVGVVALLAAIRTLKQIGMDVIRDYEKYLIDYAIKGLRCIPDIQIYSCAKGYEDKIGIIAFDLPGIYHEVLARILSCEAGIAVRSGLFCAHPYVEKLLNLTEEGLWYYQKNPDAPLPGLVRISLGLYNNYEEIDILIDLLSRIAKNKNSYNQKYNRLLLDEARLDNPLLYPPRKKLP